MSLITNSNIFYINSADRVSGTDSDFIYQITASSILQLILTTTLSVSLGLVTGGGNAADVTIIRIA